MFTRIAWSAPGAERSWAPHDDTTSGTASTVTVDRLAAVLKWTVLAAVFLTVGLFGWFTWVLPGIARSDAAAKTIMVQPFTASASDSLASAIAEQLTLDLTVALKNVPGLTFEEDRSTVSVTIGGTSPTDEPEPEPQMSSDPPNLLVEGSVKRVGDRIRISLKMTNTRRELMVWTQVTEQDVRVVPTIPADFATTVAEQIRVALFK